MSASSGPERPETSRSVHRTQPFLWSVRREIWEHHALYWAPLAVAALVLLAYVVGTVHLPDMMMANPSMKKLSGPHAPPPGLPYSIATVAVIVTGVIVAVFYCLGALHNERRDRSILFWKSLPVSDLIVVLSKAAIPLAVLPTIVFVITIVMQLIMLIVSPIVMRMAGGGVPAFWGEWSILRQAVVLLYGLVTLSLWLAPVFGWLLMVSTWARRVPFLWAVMPPLALCVAEKIAFDTSRLSSLLADRLFGSYAAAFHPGTDTPVQLAQLAPLQFLRTPDLWIGLAVTAVFLAAAIRLRRYGGPL